MLILEGITERKKNTGKGWIRRDGSSIEHRRKENYQQEWQFLQGRM